MRLRDPKVVALAHLPGFGGVRDRELELIAAEMDERCAPAGAVLVEEEGRGGELFFVIEGKAAVLISGQEVGILVPGDFVGEMSLVDQGTSGATVRALTPMRLLALPAPYFIRLSEEAAVARALARTLSERLRRVENALASARRPTVLANCGKGSSDDTRP